MCGDRRPWLRWGFGAGQGLGVYAVLEGRTACKGVSRALKKIGAENVLDHRCRWLGGPVAVPALALAGGNWAEVGRRLRGPSGCLHLNLGFAEARGMALPVECLRSVT